MKTITVKFRIPETGTSGFTETVAQASFETLPGVGTVKWTGDTAAFEAIRSGPVPAIADAGQFEEAMRAVADRIGANVEITSEGEWEVFTE